MARKRRSFHRIFILFIGRNMVIIDMEDEFQTSLQKYKKPKKILRYRFNVNSFQLTMLFPLTVLQFLWVFPLNGINGNNSRCLKVHWCSWKTFYALFCVCLHIKTGVIYDMHMNILEVNMEAFVQIIYFLYLACSWRSIVRQWESIEYTMRYYEDPQINLKRTINLIMATLFIMMTIEFQVIVLPFNKEKLTSNWDNLGIFFSNVCTLLALVQLTFIWCFKDIFIIMISIFLVARLKQIQRRILFLIKVRVDNINLWRATREDYAKLSRLCKIVNCKFSWLIIIVYVCNIQYLLVNLFLVYSKVRSRTRTVELVRIFTVLIKIILVSYFGGTIREVNGYIADLLISAPSEIYNVEVERFLLHAVSEEMILSGKNVFTISKSLILNVANAVVTYELVIIQFFENFKQLE